MKAADYFLPFDIQLKESTATLYESKRSHPVKAFG